MDHIKTYHAKEIEHPNGAVIIEGPISANELAKLKFHKDLVAFRPPTRQHQALTEIASQPEGRVIIVRALNEIVGYVTYSYPDPLERWSEGNIENLIELGGIEVIPEFRGGGVGKSLLEVSMMDHAMENYIILTMEYYWHWDLKGTRLTIWEYRKMMEKMMNAGGLEIFATDEPEISSHPANCLMARIGDRVSSKSIEQFNQLRFQTYITC